MHYEIPRFHSQSPENKHLTHFFPQYAILLEMVKLICYQFSSQMEHEANLC